MIYLINLWGIIFLIHSGNLILSYYAYFKVSNENEFDFIEKSYIFWLKKILEINELLTAKWYNELFLIFSYNKNKI